MIKNTELRIGNFVLYQGNYVSVDWNSLGFDHTHFDLIPLTPEILEQAYGFVELVGSKSFWWKWNGVAASDAKKVSRVYRIKESWCVHFFKDGRAFFSSLDIELHSLHQLQNLYFSLTGEELTIKELA